MKKINGANLVERYGTHADAIPHAIWAQVHQLVTDLKTGGVYYPDIDARNFMQEHGTDKVYIIDFEHAYPHEYVDFVQGFVGDAGDNPHWNEEF